MTRTLSLAGNSCWKSSLSLLLVGTQIWTSLQAGGMQVAVSQRPSSKTANGNGLLSQARVLMTPLQMRINKATAEVVSALNPPSELSRLASQFEEPLIRTAPTRLKEDQALLQALLAYQKRVTPDDLRSLEVFLSDYPSSGWGVAVLTNLGLSYYHYGHFSKAIEAWEHAWQMGKSVTGAQPRALTDRAIGELIRMHARIGHADQVAALLKELDNRPVTGPATEAVDGARQGLWMMRNNPGVAYLCGPMALRSLLLSERSSPASLRFLSEVRSGTQGFTLAQVAQLADRAKLSYKLVFRSADQPIPVPSLVHWKVSHFAAIVGEQDGRFHVQDPTFGSDLWVTQSAIESEASGYFLVPNDQREAWRSVGLKEADQVRGMGYTNSNLPTATTDQDDTTSDDNPQTDMSNEDNNENDATTGNNGNCGLCAYSITEMLVSIKLKDTPVGYRPAKGPAMFTTLTYNQRESSQPATFGWFNVSPKWTLNWLSYIQDDPALAGNNVTRIPGGGGSIAYSGYNSATGAFTPETRNATVLVKTSSNPVVYQRRRANGGVETF